MKYDSYAMSDIEKLRFIKLGPHPKARLVDPIPPSALVTQYVTAFPSDAERHHLFWIERRPNRTFDDTGQAVFRWKTRTYNVARVLLQHRIKQRVVRAVNTCGLPQCVRPDHWAFAPSFLGAVSAAATGHATVKVGEVWRLSIGGVVVDRDVVFVSTIQPASPVRHVVRALREDYETVFLTACGQLADPALVVASTQDANCAECLS